MRAPLDVLLERLADARRRGETFERAWQAARDAALMVATGSVERSQWVVALDATRGAWRASYDREPPERPHEALTELCDERGAPILEPARAWPPYAPDNAALEALAAPSLAV